jgi:hypothetical protein
MNGFFFFLLFFFSYFSYVKTAASDCMTLHTEISSQQHHDSLLSSSSSDSPILWLKGESRPSSFITQFYSILSYIPVALSLQTNLLLTDMYAGGGIKVALASSSVTTAATKGGKKGTTSMAVSVGGAGRGLGGNKRRALAAAGAEASESGSSSINSLAIHVTSTERKPVSFSSFFNVTHLQEYWKRKSGNSLKVFQWKDYEECYLNSFVLSNAQEKEKEKEAKKEQKGKFSVTTIPTLVLSGHNNISGPSSSLRILSIKSPGFASISEEKKDQLTKILVSANGTMESIRKAQQESGKPPAHVLLQFTGELKLMGLYSFNGAKGISLLSSVLESLQPSDEIQMLFNIIRTKILPTNYVATFIRLDNAAFTSPSDISKGNQALLKGKGNGKAAHPVTVEDTVDQILRLIRVSSCLASNDQIRKKDLMDLFQKKKKKDETNETAESEKKKIPTIYLYTNTAGQIKSEKNRLKNILEKLQKSGFTNIETKKTILEKLYVYLMEKENELQKQHQQRILSDQRILSSDQSPTTTTTTITTTTTVTISTSSLPASKLPKQILSPELKSFLSLSYEQLSYLEFLISLSSSCYIPSIRSSPISYLIHRLYPLYQRKKLPFDYDEVNYSRYGPSMIFKAWGI